MGTKNFDNALDLITFSRTSRGTALRRVGYGDELVTNGTFDTDISGWTLGADATASVSSGIVTVTNSSYITQSLYQEFPTEIGAFYEITATALSSNLASSFVIANKGGFTWSASGGTRQDVISGHANTTKTITYAATTNSIRITLLAYNNVGGYAEFDNISVKEVIFDRATDPLVLFNHPAEIPRIEYDAAGAVKGLLIEEARTNLLTYSQDFTNVYWTKGGDAAALVVDAIGPDGETSAVTLVDNSTGGSGTNLNVLRSVIVATSTAYTLSVFVKSSGLNWINITIASFTTPGTSRAYFDTANGVIGSVDAGFSDSTIENYGNGWYRCSVTFTTDVSDTVGQIYIAAASADGNVSVDLDGTSSILIYGAQFEAGSFPTSYIPTSGNTVTRAADVASISVSAFGYNQGVGSLVVEANPIPVGSGFGAKIIVDISNGGVDSQISLINENSDRCRLILDPEATTNDVDITVVGAEGSLMYAAAWKLNSTNAAHGGILGAEDTSNVPIKNATQVTLSSDANGNGKFSGHIKSIQYYPRRLSNAQLQELTS